MKKYIRMVASFMLTVLIASALASCDVISGNPSDSTALTEPPTAITESPATDTLPAETTAEETVPATPYGHIEHTFEGGYCTECGASEGLIYKMNDDGVSAQLIMTKSCKQEKIVIAESFKGYPVTKIGTSAFNAHRPVKEIVIPDTVTEIAAGAFMSTLIEHIKIPSGVTRIEDKTFFACRFLKTVKLPDGISHIGNEAFFECRVLEAIDLPDALTFIGDSCFSMCYELTEIEVPDGVTSLPHNFLYTCMNIEKIVLHDGITSLAGGSLNTHSNVKEVVNFPNSLVSIGGLTFPQYFPLRTEYKNCIYIGSEKNPYQILEAMKDTRESTVEIHPDTRLIAPSAFSFSNIQKLTVPDKVVFIGGRAFSQCSYLTELSISDSVSHIGGEAFGSCRALKTLKLPAALKSIEEGLFRYCESLTEIIIPPSVEYISAQVFNGCNSLKFLTVPASVKKIDAILVIPNVEIRYDGTKEEWEAINENVWQFEGCTLIAKDGTFHG